MNTSLHKKLFVGMSRLKVVVVCLYVRVLIDIV